MPTNCPSCQQAVDLSSAVCPNCHWRFQHLNNHVTTPSLVKPAVRPKIQVEIDLAITVDRTGSSEQFATGIPATAEMIFKPLAAKARSIRCWVQSHGDLDENEQAILLNDGGTVDQAIADIKRITFGGGGDPPEHHLDAIENLVKRIPWCADPSRGRGAIISFTTDDSKPTRSGVTPRQLGEDIRKRGLLLYLVCEPATALQELCDGAGGMMFKITNSPDPTDLQRIAAQLAASIVATVSRGGTQPMTV